MKNITHFFGILLMLAIGLLAGCSTIGAGQPLNLSAITVNAGNVQQVAAAFCPTVNASLTVLTTSTVVPPDMQDQFKKILVLNQGACAAVGSITAASLQQLNTQVVQAAISILAPEASIPQVGQAMLALQLLEPIVNQAITVLQANQATTPPATPAAPAVVPSAAAVKVS